MYNKRPNLSEQLNWVVVSNGQVQHFLTFQDAVRDKSGHLMTLNYYENHYKAIQDESNIFRQ